MAALGVNPPLIFPPQLLEQLRGNRSSLKPPQLQMLGQLEAQLAMMQQHQHQVGGITIFIT